jgi:hypothetical protein
MSPRFCRSNAPEHFHRSRPYCLKNAFGRGPKRTGRTCPIPIKRWQHPISTHSRASYSSPTPNKRQLMQLSYENVCATSPRGRSKFTWVLVKYGRAIFFPIFDLTRTEVKRGRRRTHKIIAIIKERVCVRACGVWVAPGGS